MALKIIYISNLTGDLLNRQLVRIVVCNALSCSSLFLYYDPIISYFCPVVNIYFLFILDYLTMENNA
jgi:hypothetical protein